MKTLNKQFFFVALALVYFFMLASCKKFLEAKTNSKIDTPHSIGDLEEMLNNYLIISSRSPSYGEFSSDNVIITNDVWNSSLDIQQALYCWQKFDGTNSDFTGPYQSIFYSNVILEQIDNINLTSVPESRIDNVRGSALFLRAYYHFGLAQEFAKPYDATTANSDLGIQLKLSSDYNEHVDRSSVAATYDQILKDYKESIRLLPTVPATQNLPSRPAAYAGLSRTYMAMRDYMNAGKYADSCLQLYSTLLNYNSIDSNAAIPFPIFNKEVIFDARTGSNSLLSSTKGRVDSALYKSYLGGDLRRGIFFKKNSDGSVGFKGSYTGFNVVNLFSGFATDEVYLNRAECLAREGNKDLAIHFLDILLSNRWKTGSYVPGSATNADEALALILAERRKELVYRGLRWSDLRRLNFEQRFEKTLTRTVNGVEYQLPPQGLRYVFLIPDEFVKSRGIVQNP